MTIGPLPSNVGALTSQVDTDCEVIKRSEIDPIESKRSSGPAIEKEGKSDRVELQQTDIPLKKGTYSLQEIAPTLNNSVRADNSDGDSLGRQRLEEIRVRIQNNYYGKTDVLNSIVERMIDITTEDFKTKQ